MNESKLGFMFDIETLDTGPLSVITQIAFVAFDLADPESIVKKVTEYLPIQPQVALNRTMSADTIIWWMQQDDAARARFKENDGSDMDELLALVRSISRKFNQLRDSAGDYEIWARGPQFDIVNVESLMIACGESPPWDYWRVRDLRTLMSLADLTTADVPRNPDYTPHIALDDCMYQVDCYVAAIRHLRAAR